MTACLEYRIYRRRFRRPLVTAAGVFHERVGIVLRRECLETGCIGFGEIAPWPGFGGESLAAAESFLRAVQSGAARWEEIPRTLPCTRAARAMTERFFAKGKMSRALLHSAGLLAGGDCEEELRERRANGFSTFKVKIGAEEVRRERARVERLLELLESGEKLRLDANGGLASLEEWLPVLCCDRVDFLEQPFPPERMSGEFFPEEIACKLALDESIVQADSLPEEWPGWVVVKPLLLADWTALEHWRGKPRRAVYSSVFETAIGREALLRLAGGDARSATVAHGLDTLAALESDGWTAHAGMAEARPLDWLPEEWDAWWRERVGEEAGGEKRYFGAGDKTAIIRVTAERFLREQLFPHETAETAWEAFATAEEILRQRPEASLVVAEREPACYVGAVLAAWCANRHVFCANPHWQRREWDEAIAFFPKEIVGVGAFPEELVGGGFVGMGEISGDRKTFIPTGGTGGKVKFVRHDWATLTAAARAQLAVVGAKRLGSGSPLPPWHVSGLLPVVRTMVSGGWLWLLETLPGAEGAFPGLLPEMRTLLSLVPTQLRLCLQTTDGTAWLRRWDCVLLGGAACGEDLLTRARVEKVPLALGYGMTETAAFAAWQGPEEFLRGEKKLLQPLPGVGVEIVDADGRVALAGETGRVGIVTPALAEGVGEILPDGRRRMVTQDEGRMTDGRLELLGRTDRFIVTGGEKVDPRRVEMVLQGVEEIRATLVVGEDDAEWGRRVVALVELDGPKEDGWEEKLAAHVRRELARHCVPKRWIAVARLPLNERGKIDHAALAEILRR